NDLFEKRLGVVRSSRSRPAWGHTAGVSGRRRKEWAEERPMSEAKIHVIGGTRVDSSSEQRLVEIRQEAERRGEVRAIGIRPSGAPFPKASPETGYYGLPLPMQPPWTWEVPLYFFVVASAGAASSIRVIPDYTGAASKLYRDGR